MSRALTISAATVLTLICTISVFSQSFEKEFITKDDSSKCFKFRGQPKPDCCSYLILETGLLKRFQVENKNTIAYISDIGLMGNFGDNWGAGGSIVFFGDDEGVDVGLGPRLRRWIVNQVALDFSPRILLTRTGAHNLKSPGHIISLSLSMGDLFSVDIHHHRATYVRDISNTSFAPNTIVRTDDNFYLGVTTRSYFTVAVPAAAIVVGIVLRVIDTAKKS